MLRLGVVVVGSQWWLLVAIVWETVGVVVWLLSAEAGVAGGGIGCLCWVWWWWSHR